MQPIESTHRKFPFALTIPDLMPEKHEERFLAMKEWANDLGLVFNIHYICFEAARRRYGRSTTVSCWAFSEKWMTLQFKLKFSAW